MKLVNAKSITAPGVLIDALAADHPEEEPGLRRIQSVYDIANGEIATATSSAELTPIGKQAAAVKAITKASGAMAPHDATAARLKATADATRARALSPPSEYQRDQSIEREIRDRLHGTDPLLMPSRYFQAIETGDHAFVAAVESAPAAFALLDDVTRRRGEDMKLAKSPLAAQLAQQESEAARYGMVVATTRTELAKLAEQHGVLLVEE